MLSIGTVDASPISFKGNSHASIRKVVTTICWQLFTKQRDRSVSHIVD